MKSSWNTKLIYKIPWFYIDWLISYILARKKMEFEFFSLPFMIVPKSKILGVNLAKYVQNIYKKNCKTDERNQWRSKHIGSYSTFMN